MSAPIKKRLLKEYRDYQRLAAQGKGGAQGVRLVPVNDNLTHWEATLSPSPPSYFEGAHFEVTIRVPSSYPIRPPSIKFIEASGVPFHPNVHARTGEICLDVLQSEWSPAWTLSGACLAVLVLLDNPDADSPLNCDAGNLVRRGDLRAFRSVAQLYIALHQQPPPPDDPDD